MPDTRLQVLIDFLGDLRATHHDLVKHGWGSDETWAHDYGLIARPWFNRTFDLTLDHSGLALIFAQADKEAGCLTQWNADVAKFLLEYVDAVHGIKTAVAHNPIPSIHDLYATQVAETKRTGGLEYMDSNTSDRPTYSDD